MYTHVFCVHLFCFFLVVLFSFLLKKNSASELARRASAKGHVRVIPEHGTLRAAQTRPANVIQRIGTGHPCLLARPCFLRNQKNTNPAIWHGVTVPHGTTVPIASGFSAPISFFLFLIFLLLPHLFSLYDGKTLTSPPCYPPSPLKPLPIFFNFHS